MAYTLDIARLNIMGRAASKTRAGYGQFLPEKGEVVFVTTAAALLAGFLLPLPAWALDVLWGFGLSLAAVTIAAALVAKNCLEISAMPQLLAAATLFRMALAAGSVRTILLNNSGGIIIENTASFLTAGKPIWAAALTLTASAVIIGTIFRTTAAINKQAGMFITEILPLRNIGVDTALNIGTITVRQADSIRSAIERQTRFHVNMTGAIKFIRCQAVTAMVIVILAMIMQAALSAMRMAGTFDARLSMPSAVAILILAPELLVALACAKTLSKCALTADNDKYRKEDKTETVKIVSAQTGKTEEVELLNPDFAETAAERLSPPLRTDEKM